LHSYKLHDSVQFAPRFLTQLFINQNKKTFPQKLPARRSLFATFLLLFDALLLSKFFSCREAIEFPVGKSG
jgi:hypothetical protein